MKTTIKCFFLVCLLILNSCSNEEEGAIDEASQDIPNEISITDEILRLVNVHRQDNGLSILEKNQTAEQMAIDHTNYMISVAEINHDNFNGRSNILRDQENARGAAENVAQFYPSAESVVNGWLQSSGHRQNIEGNYTYTGIAAIRDSNGRYYYTQIFYR